MVLPLLQYGDRYDSSYVSNSPSDCSQLVFTNPVSFHSSPTHFSVLNDRQQEIGVKVKHLINIFQSLATENQTVRVDHSNSKGSRSKRKAAVSPLSYTTAHETAVLMKETKISTDTVHYRFHGQSSVSDDAGEAPSDIVTIVFTDIESSTALWAACSSAMRLALEEHDRILRALLNRFRGYEVKTVGDGFMVAFFSVFDAIHWCLAVQEALLTVTWPSTISQMSAANQQFVGKDANRVDRGTEGQMIFNGLRVRMGIHVGEPICCRNPTTKRMDYYGPVTNLTARITDTCYGGQIVCSMEVYQMVRVEVKRRRLQLERERMLERGEEDDIILLMKDEEAEEKEEEGDNNKPLSLTPHCDWLNPAIKNNLDHSLNRTTTLMGVIFVGCGAVSLKGIPEQTHIYQISSAALVKRQWEPALRVSGVGATEKPKSITDTIMDT